MNFFFSHVKIGKLICFTGERAGTETKAPLHRGANTSGISSKRNGREGKIP
jgi:hypothetical protein